MLKPYFQAGVVEAGCDEAGRGCLAGPVYAAAVILPSDFEDPLLNDSKLLTEAERYQARKVVEDGALAWAVAHASPAEIDEVNILRASFLAMHRALDQLPRQPEALLIDGNRFVPYRDLPFYCIIKGDSQYYSIAAASVLAKTYRDDFMKTIAAEYPHYKWESNKGYPTEMHREAIRAHGPCRHHRHSFRLLGEPEQGRLFD